MTKVYSLLFATLLCAPSVVLAQISIDEADMPSTGDTLQYSVGFDIGIDVDDTGPNHIWDFSNLFPISMSADTFVSVSSTPFLYQFFFNNQFLYPAHNATEAVKGTDIDLAGTTFDNLYDYYKNDGGSYKKVGFGATINGIPLSIRNVPIDHVYMFPLNYGNVDSSYSEFAVAVPLLGFYGSNQWRHNEVDGWGSITTPYGTFDAIRVKSTINATDTIYIDALQFGLSIPRPETVEYKWLAQNEGIPVLEINTLFGIPTTIKYKDDDDFSTSIASSQEEDLHLYPNPAKDQLNFRVGQDQLGATIEVFDMNGRLVEQSIAYELQNELDLSTLPTGQYVLRMISRSEVLNSRFHIVR